MTIRNRVRNSSIEANIRNSRINNQGIRSESDDLSDALFDSSNFALMDSEGFIITSL